MQDAKSEKDLGEQTGEGISQPIVEVHDQRWSGGVLEVRAGLAFWKTASRFAVEAAVSAATPESMQATRLPPQISKGASIGNPKSGVLFV